MTAVAFQHDGLRYRVRFKYDASTVALIKSSVPGYSRSWDAQARCWYVEIDWAEVLAATLRRARPHRYRHRRAATDVPSMHTRRLGRGTVRRGRTRTHTGGTPRTELGAAPRPPPPVRAAADRAQRCSLARRNTVGVLGTAVSGNPMPRTLRWWGSKTMTTATITRRDRGHRRGVGWVELTAAVIAGTPRLRGAKCVGRHELFDSNELADQDAAVAICRFSCPVLSECKVWVSRARRPQQTARRPRRPTPATPTTCEN